MPKCSWEEENGKYKKVLIKSIPAVISSFEYWDFTNDAALLH